MKPASENKNRIRRILSSCVMLMLAGAFVMLSPKWYADKLKSDPYEEWMQYAKEPTVGVIEIWHVVGFKPYSGSLGAWLDTQAKNYSKRFIGIHFEVSSMTPEEAENRLQTGKRPDMISYQKGCVPDLGLMDISGAGEAGADYCASGRLLVYDSSLNNKAIDAIRAEAGTLEEFKSGKARSCVTDIRGAGDLERAQLMGKAPYFELAALEAGDDLVQSVGIAESADEKKLPYMLGFIEYLLGEKAQHSLPSIGLLPVAEVSDPAFERDYLKELYSILLQSAGNYGNILNENGPLGSIT